MKLKHYALICLSSICVFASNTTAQILNDSIPSVIATATNDTLPSLPTDSSQLSLALTSNDTLPSLPTDSSQLSLALDSIQQESNDSIVLHFGQYIKALSNDTAEFMLRDTLWNIYGDSLLVDSAYFAMWDSIKKYTPLDSAALALLDSAKRDSLRQIYLMRLTDPLDTLSNRLFAYQVLPYHSYARTQFTIDTTLNHFEINTPVWGHYDFRSYLGNSGLAYYHIGYDKRRNSSDFLFLDNFSMYIHDPEAMLYYQTQFPYTHIDFSSAGGKALNESSLRLVHTQNVNKNWNIGMHYNVLSSVGQYAGQGSADNGFSLYSAYRGRQYALFTSFTWNNIRVHDNGGLTNIDDFLQDDGRPTDQGVRSRTGKTALINRKLYLLQTYSPRSLFGKKHGEEGLDTVKVSRVALRHSFMLDWSRREYSDTALYALRDARLLDSTFQVQAPYFSPASTFDSLHFRTIRNKFELILQEQTRKKFTAGFSVGILSEIDRLGTQKLRDTTSIKTELYKPSGPWGDDLPSISGVTDVISMRDVKLHYNTALTGSFFNHTGKHINWDINAKMYFTGYKVGNTELEGEIRMHYNTKHPEKQTNLVLGGSITNSKPTYFLNQYTSNLLHWDNDFDYMQDIRLKAEFQIPHRYFKLGAYLSQLNNHVYINNLALPQQHDNALLVGSLYAEKDFRLGGWGFLFKLYGQYSSDDAIIPLPALSMVQSTYYENTVFKNALQFRIGWELMYQTKYYAYAYMPASGMFYLQNQRQVGNFPFLDFYLNLQIKKARIFVCTDGFYSLFERFMGKEYFTVYAHPMHTIRAKFGISWAFYN